MVRIRLNDRKEIPLFLLPRIVGEVVLNTGDKIYRISVKRTHWHHYNVSVRTKALPRELAPGSATVFSSGTPPPSGNPDAAMTAVRGGSA